MIKLDFDEYFLYFSTKLPFLVLQDFAKLVSFAMSATNLALNLAFRFSLLARYALS